MTNNEVYNFRNFIIVDMVNRVDQMGYLLNDSSVSNRKKNILRKKINMCKACLVDVYKIFDAYEEGDEERLNTVCDLVNHEWMNRTNQIESLCLDKEKYTRGGRRRFRRLADYSDSVHTTICVFMTESINSLWRD